ncbi:hypothetical protein PGT21_004094 [Puccinia graminis f. sp. tritici]|uniref:Uncharacterized protein n=1 Tax=Puccinia graminis f. sp. tritici TaxID=56615 RepID=A0A5B0N607_PUCGR|nr:hypothetical protein PGTUg99_036253 [Puccinia graminis f. sp. tritici]KAA1093950.1 hypothetical protein PGT21_004094 [Puccinia graminis f. sp. tritici]
MVEVDSTPLAKVTNAMVKTGLLPITQAEPLAAVLLPEIRQLLVELRETRAETQAHQVETRANNRVVMTRLAAIDTQLGAIDTRLAAIDTRFEGIGTRLDRIEGINNDWLNHGRRMANQYDPPAPPASPRRSKRRP